MIKNLSIGAGRADGSTSAVGGQCWRHCLVLLRIADSGVEAEPVGGGGGAGNLVLGRGTDSQRGALGVCVQHTRRQLELAAQVAGGAVLTDTIGSNRAVTELIRDPRHAQAAASTDRVGSDGTRGCLSVVRRACATVATDSVGGGRGRTLHKLAGRAGAGVGTDHG